MSELTAVRVVIIAADPLVRAGLAAAVAEADGMTEVGRVADVDGLDADLDRMQPDVAVWDVGWDGRLPAAETLTELTESGLAVVLLLPVGMDDHGSGVWPGGRIRRDADAAVLVAAVHAAVAGLHVLDPAVAPTTQTGPIFDLPEPLTPREQEVLAELAAGLTNRAIGQALGISPHTVKFHVTGILQKLDAQSRTEAVAVAGRLGLLTI